MCQTNYSVWQSTKHIILNAHLCDWINNETHIYRKRDRLTASFISPVNDPPPSRLRWIERQWNKQCVLMQIACMANHVEVGYPRFGCERVFVRSNWTATGPGSDRKSSGRASHYLSNCILVQYLHSRLVAVVDDVFFFYLFRFWLLVYLQTRYKVRTATNGIILKSFETT